MIPKFRAWDKRDKEIYLVDEINWDRGEFQYIGDAITFQRLADEVELMKSKKILLSILTILNLFLDLRASITPVLKYI